MMPGLEQLVVQCAPGAAPQTIMAIVKTESAGRPWTINVNGRARLARQPASLAQAAAWADWLVRHGYSVDIGLMQVNSRHLARFGATPEQMLDPCFNIAAGTRILSEYYDSASLRYGGRASLLAALSAYNTGNFRAGVRNGYVGRVVKAASARVETVEGDPQPGPELLVFGTQHNEPTVTLVTVPSR